MKDKNKTKEQLINELVVMRQRITELETPGPRPKQAESKQAKETLRSSEEHFRKIFDHSNDAIFIIDPAQDEILDVNDRACSMLGFSRPELLSLPISAIHPNEMPQLQAFAQSVAEQGHGWTNELSCLTKTGQALPSEISASIIDIDGKSCLIALVRDITKRKQAEAALQKAHDQLEQRVKERTTELSKAIVTLEEQISERKRAEAALQESEEQLRQLKGAIHKLPKKQRDVFVLKEYGDLSYQEIAETLNIELGTVMSRLNRARRAIKEQIEGEKNV